MPPSDVRVSGRRFVTWLIVAFVASLVAAGIFSLWIVQGVRKESAENDRLAKALGWRLLVYADVHGDFPDAPQQILTTPFQSNLIASLAPAPSSTVAWPVTAAEAGAEGTTDDDLREAIARLALHIRHNVGLPPTITAEGRPTGHGVLATINGWLDAAGRHLRARRSVKEDSD